MNNKRLETIKERAEDYFPTSFEEDGRLIQQFREDINDLVGSLESTRSLLDEAVTGLKWWAATYPDGASPADQEFYDKVDSVFGRGD